MTKNNQQALLTITYPPYDDNIGLLTAFTLDEKEAYDMLITKELFSDIDFSNASQRELLLDRLISSSFYMKRNEDLDYKNEHSSPIVMKMFSSAPLEKAKPGAFYYAGMGHYGNILGTVGSKTAQGHLTLVA